MHLLLLLRLRLLQEAVEHGAESDAFGLLAILV